MVSFFFFFSFLGCEEEVRTLGINLFHGALKHIERQLSGNDDIIASYSFPSTINIGSTSNLLFCMHRFDLFFFFNSLYFFSLTTISCKTDAEL